jgi:ATP/maltotriose-dependent transcriptional regulator MalT/DNA-binding SARP family transcriptional activator
MSHLIVRTKIIPPRRRPNLFSRPRLLHLLDELLYHRLILLVAPAGYGKTCALIDYAHHTAWPVCWYALDLHDRDLFRFFTHFIAAINQRFPGFGPASNAVLDSYINRQSTLEQFVITVVNELYEQVTENFLLVVDDYHLVDDREEINTFFSQLVQQMDEHCHILLASRRLLSLPDMPLLVVRGYVRGLDHEDLAFDTDEVQAVVLNNYGQKLSTAEANEMVKVTEGWVTGLLLSAQSRLRNISERMRRLRAVGVDLYDYLAHQVLDQQPTPVRQFLLRSAALEEFDAALCAEIFEPAWLPSGVHWTDLIDEVLRRNLFAITIGESDEWVRYHPLLREFLQRRLATELPQEETLILQRLAVFHTEHGAWERAYHCYHRLGDLLGTADLAEKAGLSLLQNGRSILLGEWLNALPPDLVQARAGLLSLQGDVLARHGEVVRALDCLNRAESLYRRTDEMLELARTLVRRAVAQRLLGNYQAALADSEQALILAAQDIEPNPQTAKLHALALKSKGLVLHLDGNWQMSIAALEKSLAIYQSLDDSSNIATIASDLALVYASVGHHTQGRTLFHFSLDTFRRLGNIAAQATALNNLGVLEHLQGNYVQALLYLQESRECAQRSGYTRFVVFALAGLGDLFADLEVVAAAQQLYREALLIAQKINERFLLLYLELVMARLADGQREWRQAFDHLSQAGEMVMTKSSGYEWALYRLAIGRSYLAQGKAGEAVVPLQEAQAQFCNGGQPTEEATAHFFLAAAWQAQTERELAGEHLQAGLALTFASENRHPLVVAVRPVKQLLRELALSGEVKTQAQQLAAEVDAFERKLPTLCRQMRQNTSPALAALLVETPPRLVIKALGRAEVTLDGHTITNSDWQTQISRDIFFCLLAHPDGLTKEEIGTLFWPEASPSELKTRFKNAVYRLRGALNPQIILFEDEIYRFNYTFDYEYDVELFLNKVAEGDASTEPIIQIATYTAALQHYHGVYLPDIDATWVWNEREHLRQLFTDTALKLAELQFGVQDYRGTLQSCQRLLTDDPCLEDAHRLAMRVYAATGNRAAIARQYTLCTQALLKEIDVPPSPQTEALYSQLMRS